MQVGDSRITVGQALEILQWYSECFPDTIRYYDGVVACGRQPVQNPHHVTMADIGRLVIIDSDLRPDDVPDLLGVDAASAFSAVPVDAQLEDAAPGTDLLTAATRLLDLFALGEAKRSKLLHLKRPLLVPIYDTHSARRYGPVTAESYWQATRQDLLTTENQNAFEEIEAELRKPLQEPPRRHLLALGRLRWLDILARALGAEPRAAEREVTAGRRATPAHVPG